MTVAVTLLTVCMQEGDESDDSHFTLSTTQFDLDPGGEISVKVGLWHFSCDQQCIYTFLFV